MSDYTIIGQPQTEIPWREWYDFNIATLQCAQQSLALADVNNALDQYVPHGYIGDTYDGVNHTSWITVCKPKDADFQLVAGADKLITWGIYYTVAENTFSGIVRAGIKIIGKGLNDPTGETIDWNRITCLKYDGVNEWAFPILSDSVPFHATQRVADPTSYCIGANCFIWSEMPLALMSWQYVWYTLGGMMAVMHADDLFDFGIVIEDDIGVASGEFIKLSCVPEKLKIYYFNPVVNSFSHTRYPEDGGEDFVLSGIGFKLPESFLDAYSHNADNTFNDRVYKITFEGLQGQGDFVVSEPDFTISNTEITIASGDMPALTYGSYIIKLEKKNDDFAQMGEYEAYAGDWRAQSDGKMLPGNRLYLVVADDPVKKKKPVFLTKWRWRLPDGTEVDGNYAPIDVIAPTVFYQGRLLNIGNITGGISNESGLYKGADINIRIADTDGEIQALLAQYKLYNSTVDIWYAYEDEAEGAKQWCFRGVVKDYRRVGQILEVTLGNFFHKYFEVRVPKYTITRDEYPNCADNAIGKPMPEVLGDSSYSADEASGAIEAFCIDTTTYKYLASRGSLKAVTGAFGDGELIDSADYNVTYEDGGRTMITFANDQGEKKITFNAQGYMFNLWDSADGYVQNPAYIVAFFLAFIAEMAQVELNLEDIDTLAGIFEDMGEETSGFLVIDRDTNCESVLVGLLFSFGILCYFEENGILTFKRKDISNFQSTILILTQVDTIGDPTYYYNFAEVVNKINAKWNAVPAGSIYQSAQVFTYPASIAEFGKEKEDDKTFGLLWVNSDTLAEERVQTELYRRGYGKPYCTFSLPIDWIDKIQIFDNFRLQNPFAPSVDKSGTVGQYFYLVEKNISPDRDTIECIGYDLSWIVRQYLLLGDEDELSSNWSSAPYDQKMWAFVCDEADGLFANGEPGKRLLDENTI